MGVLRQSSLEHYRKKRKFEHTPEPQGTVKTNQGSIFVIQKHAARALHYDFRLEVNGVLASWAVPKGVPRRAGIRRLAVKTEDHPLEYATFAGTIPKGQYGGGTVEIFDYGIYQNIRKKNTKNVSMQTSIEEGLVEVCLYGALYSGCYVLVRTNWSGSKEQWLVMKKRVRT